MWTKQHKQRNTGRLIVPAITAAFLSYFGFHAYNGEYGINSKFQLEQRIGFLEQKLERVKAERMRVEARARLLHDGTIERDMLDEQARRALDYSRADELTIVLPNRE